jgi:2-methylisocitrate lyase-like PEP mutase family enzyme
MNLAEQLNQGSSILIVPGVVDALGARIVADIGFKALYVSGAGLTNATLGVPDLSLITATELASAVDAIRNVVDMPIIVDADTGFGGPLNVRRTVRTLEQRGANAIQLEDQTFPKRCGHFYGKQVIPTEEMVAKIQAALDARQSDSTLIIARTDAREQLGLDAAIEPAAAYFDAGADATFVEAPRSRDELMEIGARLPRPQLVNMVEGGQTPLLEADELRELGFALALYANAGLRAAIAGMRTVLEHLFEHGSTLGVVDRMVGWDERQRLLGKDVFDELDARYATPESDSMAL